MAKYRKKPVVIEAERFDPQDDEQHHRRDDQRSGLEHPDAGGSSHRLSGRHDHHGRGG